MLEVRGLKVSYGPIQVVHGIDLDVKEGECVALIGANGAGKSSTLKAICGLVPASEGTIHFEEEDITNGSGHAIVKAGITMCPEGRQVFPQMNVLQNLRMGAYARDDDAQASDLDEMMAMFPILRERAKQSAGTLSGGEQEMLAIARALMARPKLCIFDEPSLGLAPKIVAEVARPSTGSREWARRSCWSNRIRSWPCALLTGPICSKRVRSCSAVPARNCNRIRR